MTFTPSPLQRAYFDFLRAGRGSAVVEAVAGSGKTTTVIEGLPLLDERLSVQLFAFNTVIAGELKERLARKAAECGRAFRNMRASTFHSVGFGAVCKRLGRTPRQVVTDGKKCRTLFRELVGDRELGLYEDFVPKLVSLAKGQGVGALVPDTEAAWYELIGHHDLFLDSEDATEERAVELARQLLRASNQRAQDGWLDFDDQLYLPLLWRCRLWQNDVVFIDEAQDTNPVRRALAKLALRPGGRLIAVGDARQAIYGFTGASHDALDLIRAEFGATSLPLTVCYRCDRAVVESARALVPHLEAAPGAAEGEVRELTLREVLPELAQTDVVLCRNTAPLVTLAYGLIARGTACHVLGKDIGRGLANLVRQQRARTVDGLVEKLESYRDREVAKYTAKGEEQKAEAVSDRVECVLTIVDHLPETERTVGKLLARIEALFSDENGALTLSTIHKAKGREWDRVYVLRPELLPSKWARQEWQQRQEENLDYVCRTRARHVLTFLTTHELGD
jgi:DNA helicase-2/ATP-dependent DNA helicase PcrA